MSDRPEEKRHYERYRVRHDAVLVVAGHRPQVVRLENVCEGGAFLSGLMGERLHEALTRPTSPSLMLHVFVGDEEQPEQVIRVAGTCVRVQQDQQGAWGLGLAFDAPVPELSAWARRTGGRGRVLGTREREKLESQFQTMAAEFFASVATGLVDELKARLDDRLARAEDFQTVNRLRDQQVILMTQRRPFSRAFHEAMVQGWERLYPEASDRGGHASLEVVDKRAFEQWLELQMIASAVSHRNRDALFRLHQVLNAVFRVEVDERNNPLGPRKLCEALQTAFQSVPDWAVLDQDLAGAFEQVLLEALPGLYQSLLEQAAQAGIRTLGETEQYAPGLRRQSRKRAAVKQGVSPAGRSASGGEETDDHSEAATAGAGSASADHTAGPGRRAQSVLRLAEVVGGWTTQNDETRPYSLDVWREAVEQDTALQAGQPVQALVEELVKARPELASQGAPVAVNLAAIIDQLFSVLSGVTAADELINRLRLPLFELILEDMSFLEDRDHPLRRLLDDLVSLTASENAVTGTLRKTLDPIVDELVRGRFRDPDFVNRACQRVHSLVQRQERAFLRNAERIARMHEGREKLERARQAVRSRIGTLLRNQTVPRSILDLLAAGWEQVMVHALLKEGPDSALCSEHFTTLNQLLDWLRLDDADADALYSRDLESPAVLEMLERELATAAEPARVASALKTLRCQLSGEGVVERVMVTRYPPDQPDDRPESTGKVIRIAPERWRRRATELKAGDWVELDVEAGRTQRMRLVWLSDQTYKFVFLAQNGLQEIEIPLDEMARWLAEGRARRTDPDSVSLVDKGLYDAIQSLYAKMASQATHDPLTGCVQRREFEKHLERVVYLTQHAGADSALILFDLDNFRLINSQYGTPAGDELLARIPRLLDEQLKPHDGEMLLGRSGSNEFGLLLYPCSHEDALDMAASVVKAVERMACDVDGQTVHVTASAGVVLVKPGSPNASALLTQASQAVRLCKEHGGNGWQLYKDDDARLKKEAVMMHWAGRLDRPFDEGDLCLTAQLIRGLNAEQTSCEILLQIRDEQGRPGSPVPLIEAAERFGRITQLDRWIVEGALKWMAVSPAALSRLHHVSINLSGYSLSDDRFLDWLDTELGRYPALLSRLCFEVTETAAVSQVHYTVDFMQHLRRKGVRFALDDFGTGLSSYAYLQQLPVDYLKIDGVFVRDIDTDLTHYAMVKSINELGHFMKLETVAECVETPAIVECLQELGVDWAQGYLYSRPVPLGQLGDALGRVQMTSTTEK